MSPPTNAVSAAMRIPTSALTNIKASIRPSRRRHFCHGHFQSFSIRRHREIPHPDLPPAVCRAGITLTAGGLLSGTPPLGSDGYYYPAITATNGVQTNATLYFALVVLDGNLLAAHPNFNTNGLGWTLNGDSVNGGPNIANNIFTLTDGTGGENPARGLGSRFTSARFKPRSLIRTSAVAARMAWRLSFKIPPAARQRLRWWWRIGFIGISPSVAVLLDIYGGAPGGPSGVLVATNGNGDSAGYWPSIYQSTAPVNSMRAIQST